MTLIEKAQHIVQQFQATAKDDQELYGSAYSPLSEREMDALLMFDDARKLDQHFSSVEEARQQYALKQEAFIESLNETQMGHYVNERMRIGDDDQSEHLRPQTEGKPFPHADKNFDAYMQDVLQDKDFSKPNGYPYYDSLTPQQRAENWVLMTLSKAIRDYKQFTEEMKPGTWPHEGSLFYGGERNVLLNPDFAKKCLSTEVADKDYDAISLFERALKLSGQLRENALDGEESGYFLKKHQSLSGPKAHTLLLIGLEDEPEVDFNKISQLLDGQIKQELLTSVKPRPSSHGVLYEFACPYKDDRQTESQKFLLHLLRFQADPRSQDAPHMFVRSEGQNYTMMDAIQAEAAAGDQMIEAALDVMNVPRYPYMDPSLPNLNDAEYVVQFKGPTIQKILVDQFGMDCPDISADKNHLRRFG